MRTALRLSSNSAAVGHVAGHRHTGRVARGRAIRHRIGPGRAVAGAWVGRSDAARHDRRVRGICQCRHATAAAADPPRRNSRWRGAVFGAASRRACGKRSNRLPDDSDAVGRAERRHRMAGAARRVHASGGREDRHDERRTTTHGSLATRRIWQRACGSATTIPRTIAARGYAATLAVPLWGRFMSIATQRDPPRPFPLPANVTSVTICRLSGKRATDACRMPRSSTAMHRRRSVRRLHRIFHAWHGARRGLRLAHRRVFAVARNGRFVTNAATAAVTLIPALRSASARIVHDCDREVSTKRRNNVDGCVVESAEIVVHSRLTIPISPNKARNASRPLTPLNGPAHHMRNVPRLASALSVAL